MRPHAHENRVGALCYRCQKKGGSCRQDVSDFCPASRGEGMLGWEYGTVVITGKVRRRRAGVCYGL